MSQSQGRESESKRIRPEKSALIAHRIQSKHFKLIAPSTCLCFVSYEMRSLVLRQASKKSEIDESVRVFTVVSVVQNASNLTVTALLIY